MQLGIIFSYCHCHIVMLDILLDVFFQVSVYHPTQMAECVCVCVYRETQFCAQAAQSVSAGGSQRGVQM